MPGHEDVPPAPTEDPAYTKLADVDTAYKPGKDITRRQTCQYRLPSLLNADISAIAEKVIHNGRVFCDIAERRTTNHIRVFICVANSNGLALASIGLILRSGILKSTQTRYWANRQGTVPSPQSLEEIYPLNTNRVPSPPILPVVYNHQPEYAHPAITTRKHARVLEFFGATDAPLFSSAKEFAQSVNDLDQDHALRLPTAQGGYTAADGTLLISPLAPPVGSSPVAVDPMFEPSPSMYSPLFPFAGYCAIGTNTLAHRG
ncbi:hypothetical protein BJV77DRAFT_1072575 [Russula vinacea]|nr:hypothetical protein BJV77DRAFT_1072575 [Russula vinacea]